MAAFAGAALFMLTRRCAHPGNASACTGNAMKTRHFYVIGRLVGLVGPGVTAGKLSILKDWLLAKYQNAQTTII